MQFFRNNALLSAVFIISAAAIIIIGVAGIFTSSPYQRPIDGLSTFAEHDGFESAAEDLSLEASTAKTVHDQEEKAQLTPDGARMFAIIEQLLRYGPRFLSAEGHLKAQKFLIAEIGAAADEVVTQKWRHVNSDGSSVELTNVIGRFAPEKQKRIILGTHYDSKKYAREDKKSPLDPVPGANDSASGVAALLEIARILAILPGSTRPDIGVDIVFFDGEEGEEEMIKWTPGRVLLGSTYFSEHLGDLHKTKPVGGVVLDMICDKNLEIYKEKHSMNAAALATELFWKTAKEIAPPVFKDSAGLAIEDDHVPLNQAGVPSLLIIDFDYPYWHTTADTEDKCSSESLAIVAKAVLGYISIQSTQ